MKASNEIVTFSMDDIEKTISDILSISPKYEPFLMKTLNVEYGGKYVKKAIDNLYDARKILITNYRYKRSNVAIYELNPRYSG